MRPFSSKTRTLWQLALACCAALSVGISAHSAQAQGYTAIGDSLTYGLNANPGTPATGSPHPDGFAPKFNSRRVAFGGNATFRNRGVSGATSQDLINNQLTPAVGDAPDVVTVTVGTNDIRQAIQSPTLPTPQAFGTQFGARLTALFSGLRGATTPATRQIYATNVPPLEQLPAFVGFDPTTKAAIAAYVQAANAAFVQVAPNYGVTIVNLFSDPGSVNPANISSPPEVGGDGVHPNATGHTLLARKFFAAAGLQETGSLTVTRADDVTDAFDDQTTLREALAFANGDAGASTILFSPLFNTARTITLSRGELPISTNVTLNAPVSAANANLLTLTANNASRIFSVTSGGNFTLSNVTITGGFSNSKGGGILSNGTLTLSNSTLSGNTSNGDNGGALYSYGPLVIEGCLFTGNTANGGGALTSGTTSYSGGTIPTNHAQIRNSTFVGNTATSTGGGIHNFSGFVLLDSCTIVGNTAPDGNGGGLFSFNDTLTQTRVRNSIIVGNLRTGGSDGTDVNRGFTRAVDSQGSNFVGDGNATGDFSASGDSTGRTLATTGVDTLNGAPRLASNGGPTQTVALIAGSPAINAGSTDLTTDQRGTSRPQRGAKDIGAFEYVNTAPSITAAAISPTNPKTNDTLTATPSVTNLTGANDPESDTLSFTYQWKNGNTVLSETGPTLDLSVAGIGNRGDSITVTVTATDSLGAASAPVTPSAVTVQNSAPVVKSAIITPNKPSATTILAVNTTATDADGDAGTLSYQWQKNGQDIVGATNFILDLARQSNVARGDVITVIVSVNDGSAPDSLSSAPVTSPSVTIENFSPTVVSVLPQATTDAVGTNRTFTLTVSDPNSTRDISEMWLLINTRLDWAEGATLIYSPATGEMYLRRGDTFLGPIKIGSAAGASDILDNGALRIVGSQVSVETSGDGNGLTLTIPATVRNGLVGNNTLYGRVQDASGQVDPAAVNATGFVGFGPYTVTPQFQSGANRLPTLSALSPKAANTVIPTTGTKLQSFVFYAKDEDGIGDLDSLWFMAGKQRDWTGNATFVFIPRTRRLYLRSDDGQSFLGGGVIGTQGTIENSQVKVDLSQVQYLIYADGKNVGLRLPLQPKAGLIGQNQIWLRVQDNSGATSTGGDTLGFVQSGTWNVSKQSSTNSVAPSAPGS